MMEASDNFIHSQVRLSCHPSLRQPAKRRITKNTTLTRQWFKASGTGSCTPSRSPNHVESREGCKKGAHRLIVESSDVCVESSEDGQLNIQQVTELIPWKGARKLIIESTNILQIACSLLSTATIGKN